MNFRQAQATVLTIRNKGPGFLYTCILYNCKYNSKSKTRQNGFEKALEADRQ